MSWRDDKKILPVEKNMKKILDYNLILRNTLVSCIVNGIHEII